MGRARKRGAGGVHSGGTDTSPPASYDAGRRPGRNLRLRMRPVFGTRDQPVDRPSLHPIGRPHDLARGRARNQGKSIVNLSTQWPPFFGR